MPRFADRNVNDDLSFAGNIIWIEEEVQRSVSHAPLITTEKNSRLAFFFLSAENLEIRLNPINQRERRAMFCRHPVSTPW